MNAEAHRHVLVTSSSREHGRGPSRLSVWVTAIFDRCRQVLSNKFVAQLAVAFLAYYLAGKLGQATTAIRSGNLGPVWPAFGIALAVVLAYGYRVWPAVAASAFLVALQSPVSPFTAIGQAAGATMAALVGAFVLRQLVHFDPALGRLRDAIALIILGAFGSATVSATIGIASLYAAGLQPYSGLPTAWLIYCLGDATGVLLVTPMVFTLHTALDLRSRARIVHLAVLVTLVTAVSVLVFADLALFSVRLHVLAFAILPFVMWAAIEFGVGGASLVTFLAATIATVLTALGLGPFSGNTPFINAALLDVLFTVLSATGLLLAAVIAERGRAEADRERLVRAQAASEARLRLAAIVESSQDAVLSMNLDGVILSWNAAAQHIFGFSEAEVIGQPTAILIPPELENESKEILQRLRGGQRIDSHETIRMTKERKKLSVSVTVSALRDADGILVGAAQIVRDITRQKQAEEALSSVSRRLIDAQEQERKRIARELHDDIGQRIALMAVALGGLTKATASSPRVHTQTLDLARQAAEITADVQALSHQLHSSRLELLGMTATMRQFCAEFAEQQHAVIKFTVRDVPDHVPPDIALCLFRILQESLHNAAKHSAARLAEVQLWYAQDEIHLVVSDRGKGFDVDAAKRGRGIGLVSMEERIKLVDGQVSIESQAGSGTTIHARVRCSPSQSVAAV